MSPVIIDAGPCLTFLAANHERILIAALGRGILAPETVKNEVKRKSSVDPRRFSAAWSTWKKLEANGWLEVMSDDVTPALSNAFVSIQPQINDGLAQRMTNSKNLGEILVLSHAVRIATEGASVTVVIDEIDGRNLAIKQAQRLQRLKARGQPVGGIRLLGTHAILLKCARTPQIPDRSTMSEVYKKLRHYDDGLVSINQTELLHAKYWR